MGRRIMIRSLAETMAWVKEMNVASQDERAGDYREVARDAVNQINFPPPSHLLRSRVGFYGDGILSGCG